MAKILFSKTGSPPHLYLARSPQGGPGLVLGPRAAVRIGESLALVLTGGEKPPQEASTVKSPPKRSLQSCVFLNFNKGS